MGEENWAAILFRRLCCLLSAVGVLLELEITPLVPKDSLLYCVRFSNICAAEFLLFELETKFSSCSQPLWFPNEFSVFRFAYEISSFCSETYNLETFTTDKIGLSAFWYKSIAAPWFLVEELWVKYIQELVDISKDGTECVRAGMEEHTWLLEYNVSEVATGVMDVLNTFGMVMTVFFWGVLNSKTDWAAQKTSKMKIQLK